MLLQYCNDFFNKKKLRIFLANLRVPIHYIFYRLQSKYKYLATSASIGCCVL